MNGVGGRSGKVGITDKCGAFLVRPEFDDARAFSEGLALVRQGPKFGFIDQGGSVVINPQFDDADSFDGGVARVAIGGAFDSGQARIGYIDKSGRYVVIPTGF